MNNESGLLKDFHRLMQKFGIGAEEDTQAPHFSDNRQQVITLHMGNVEARLMERLLYEMMLKVQPVKEVARMRVERAPITGNKEMRAVTVVIPNSDADAYTQVLGHVLTALEESPRVAMQVRAALELANGSFSRLPGRPYPSVALEFEGEDIGKPIRAVANVENMDIRFAEDCARIDPSLRRPYGQYDKTSPSAVTIPMDSPHVGAVQDLISKTLGISGGRGA